MARERKRKVSAEVCQSKPWYRTVACSHISNCSLVRFVACVVVSLDLLCSNRAGCLEGIGRVVGMVVDILNCRRAVQLDHKGLLVLAWIER